MKFKEIIQPIDPIFQKFKEEFSKAMVSDTSLINDVFKHIQNSQGKQIRPVLILLSAEICGGVTPRSYQNAVLMEMLHLGTLLHDDVIDESKMRRNQQSVNEKWDNKVAILVGDYLFSEALEMVASHKNYEMLDILNETVREVCQGEFIQMENTTNIAISEDIYYDIIRKKTATIFATACASGAISANASEKEISTLRQIGLDLGIAFQIKDDLLDLLPNAETGKPKGNDINEQKLTLPLIHFLRTASESDRKMALDTVQNHHLDMDKIQDLSQQILNSESLTYVESKIAEHLEKARTLLNSFPDGEGKSTFQNLIDFVANRDY